MFVFTKSYFNDTHFKIFLTQSFYMFAFMIKYTLTYTIFILFFVLSCKSKNKGSAENDSDTVARFPIIELLQNDADDVEKIPYFLYSITSNAMNKKRLDSIVLTREQFKAILKPILTADIGSEKAKKLFTESSFHDLSLNSISVVVKANTNQTQLQSIAAILDDKKNKLKNATITFEFNNNDTLTRKRFYWKVGKSITIATSKRVKDSIVAENTQYINWNEFK